jgi:hypothetical protein
VKSRIVLSLGLVVVLVAGALGLVGCVLPPAEGTAWPGPENTGVPAGTSLVPVNGDLTVSEPNALIDARDVSGTIYVNAPNVTIQRSLQDTEIGPESGIGNGYSGSGVGLGSSNFRCVRCDIHNLNDGIRANGGVIVEDSWIHDLGSNNHNDGIQRYAPGSSGDDVLRHNFIDMGGPSNWRNAAIFYSDDWRGTVTIDNNLLSGAYFTIQNLGSGSMRVTNNVWKRASWKYGPFRFQSGALTEFSGNTLDDGTPLDA